MRLLQWSIFKRMTANTVITFVLLGAIATTTQVLNQLYRLIEASSNFGFAFRLYAFLVPTVTVTILPVAFLIGVMGVYRAMEEDRESVIVAASGAALGFILRPAIYLAAIVSAVVLLVSALVEPLANREVRNSIALLTTDIAEYVASQGILTEIQRGLFVRGGTRSSDGEIQGLFILDRRDPAQEIIYIAEGGRVAEDDGNLVLEMFGGAIHVRATQTGRVHRFEFGRYMSSVPWFEGAEALAYRPRETTTPVLLATHLGGAELGFQRSEARSELVRRFTDWLYPFAYLGVGATVLILSRGRRFAYRWLMPTALVAGVGVKAVGLGMIGTAGTALWAVIVAFALPVLAALSPIAVAGLKELPRMLRA
ncbi:MAG: LptF/LptG family permease [Paracoccaceae bacterium]|nr:LptF/LptG family permease [Paracoccaceae bacterium]